MSLGKKSLILFLVLGLAICVGSYLALRVSVLPAFEEFEHQATEEALARVNGMLDADLHALEIMNIEYSAWDDTYEFVLGELPGYLEDNLDPAYWHSIDIDLMAIVDERGNRLFAWLGDPADGAEIPLADEISAALQPGSLLATHESPTDYVSGLLRVDGGLLQVVSYPILTSDGGGPSVGALVTGQILNRVRLEDLGRRTTSDPSIHVIGDKSLPTHIVSAFRNIQDPDAETAVVTYGQHVHGLKVIRDLFGNPAAVLEIRQPRQISRIGANAIRTAMILLAAGSLGFLLAALFFIQKLIVSPVRELTEKIRKIKYTGELEFDAGDPRSDEVGVLESNFAELTSGLGKTRAELEAARDEALSMSQAKSEFLARMSHEIRTPMNGVLGMTELLQNTRLDDKQKRFAKTIYSSAESLLHIINDILDLSKIEAGKLELDIAPFNLRHMVEESLELMADSAHRKDLELVGVITDDTHTLVEGDALRLRQVLINLLSNAVKFTDRGEIIVRVNEEEGSPDYVFYRFEIEDTGVGISPENAAKIFEPFTQEDGSTTRRYGGTGLGLSICTQLLELMDGEIGVDSKVGLGTTFWFTVRLLRDVTTPDQLNPERLAGKRALIVDDNATNRETLRHQLESWHMHVEAASSGPEALGLLGSSNRDNRPFDVALLDLNMPDMNGMRLAHAIRQHVNLISMPLIMLSSVSAIDDGDGRNATDIDAWLTKPVRQARLLDALSSHLGRPRRSDELVDRPESRATNDLDNSDLKVLLAEDNPVNQMVAVGMLNQLGHETTVVANGREAVDAVREGDFDLVLMDCQMPVLDGFEAATLIRRWEQEDTKNRKMIVALTANALSGDRERCLAAGMDEYVSKPFTVEELGAAIASVMQKGRPNAGTAGELGNSRPNILIVDDNAINQQVTSAMVVEFGYSAQVVDDGEKALRAMDSDSIDLVLMDCHMPVLNGYDTTREMRRREMASLAHERTPVIAVTADLMQSNRQRCFRAGMDDYITKPFTEAQLRGVLHRWLGDSDEDDPGAAIEIDSDGFSLLSQSMTLASIDRHALEEIFDLDSSPGKSTVREIVVSYCAISTKLLLQLRSAITDGDTEQIELLAHSLKGSSGQVGAVLLTALCEQILASVRDEDPGDLISLCERAAVEHSAVIAALDRELQRIAA